MSLLSAQGMPAARIAEVTLTSPGRARDVVRSAAQIGGQSASSAS
jgi:hypothetical protein